MTKEKTELKLLDFGLEIVKMAQTPTDIIAFWQLVILAYRCLNNNRAEKRHFTIKKELLQEVLLKSGAKPTKLELFILYKRINLRIKRFWDNFTFGEI